MTAPVAIFGIGNRSRGDDAAGPLLVEGLSRWLEEAGLGTQFECFEEYQLQPENALDLVGRRLALFVDARVGQPEPVRLECLAPAGATFASCTHELSPGETLAVYRAITGEDPPPSFVLGVRADSFELGDAPGEATRAAMREAERILVGLCLAPEAVRWQEATRATTPSPSPCAPLPS